MCPWRRELHICCFFNKMINAIDFATLVGWHILTVVIRFGCRFHHTFADDHLLTVFIGFLLLLRLFTILLSWQLFANVEFHNFYLTKMCANNLITKQCSLRCWTVGRQILLTQSCTHNRGKATHKKKWKKNEKKTQRDIYIYTTIEWTKK